MIDPLKCRHEKFHAECRVQSVNGQFVLYARVKCTQCNTQFAFPHGGDSITIPMTPGVLPRKKPLALVDIAALDKELNG